jgi:hypothetical protein
MNKSNITQPHLRIFGDVHGNIKSYVEIANQVPCSVQLGDMGFDYGKLADLDPMRHVFVGGNHDNYTMNPRWDLSANDPQVLDPRSNLTVVGTSEKFYLDADEEFLITTRDHLPQFDDKKLEEHLGDPDDDGHYQVVCEYSAMPPNYLGDYGWWKIPGLSDGKKLFFIRGGWSIDGRIRRRNNWGWWPREQMSKKECERAIAYYEQEKPDFVVTHTCPFDLMKKMTLGWSGLPIPNATNRMLNLMFESHQPKLWVFGHFHQMFKHQLGKTTFIGVNEFPYKGWSLDFDEHLDFIGFDEFKSIEKRL